MSKVLPYWITYDVRIAWMTNEILFYFTTKFSTPVPWIPLHIFILGLKVSRGPSMCEEACVCVRYQAFLCCTGVRNAKHVDSKAQALDLRLDAEDFGYLDDLLMKAKGPTGDIYSFERSRT